MMWLSQNQKPSYKTINRFRVNKSRCFIRIFIYSILQSVCKQNLIDDKAILLMVKIEANANRYTFV